MKKVAMLGKWCAAACILAFVGSAIAQEGNAGKGSPAAPQTNGATGQVATGQVAVAAVLQTNGVTGQAAAFRPMVVKDAGFAFGVNLDRRQVFRIVDAYADLAFKTLKLDEDEIAEAKGKIDAYKKNPFRDVSSDVKKFLDESGLDNATLRWVMLSVNGLRKIEDDYRIEGLSLAIAGTVDIEKLICAIRRKSAEEPGDGLLFREIVVGGEKAWRIDAQNRTVADTMRQMDIEPCVASLDGKLTLVAQTRDMLAALIRLYRNGEGGCDMSGRFAAADGELAYLQFSGIGDTIRQNTSADDLKEIAQVIPYGDKVALGLKRLDATIKLMPDATFSDSLRLEAASEADAENLRTLVKSSMMVFNAQLAQDPDVPVQLKRIAEGVRVGGTNGRVDVHGGGMLLLAGSAFLPKVTAAARGSETVGPRTKVDAGADK